MIKNYINTNNNIYRQIIEYKTKQKNKQKPPQTRERENIFRQEVVARWVDISGIVEHHFLNFPSIILYE